MSITLRSGTGLFLMQFHSFKGGIPAPIYFGALIDSTCLKWGHKKCGGRGACRMYDTETFRWANLAGVSCSPNWCMLKFNVTLIRFLFLGLVNSLRVLGNILLWLAITQINRKTQNDKRMSKDMRTAAPVLYDPEKQKTLKYCSALFYFEFVYVFMYFMLFFMCFVWF